MRSNNGVKAIVHNDVKAGNRKAQGGTTRGMGGAPNQENVSVRERDCEAIIGSKGSSGVEKHNGGVGDMGAGAPWSVEPGDR